jgi:hypothetical protein
VSTDISLLRSLNAPRGIEKKGREVVSSARDTC